MLNSCNSVAFVNEWNDIFKCAIAYWGRHLSFRIVHIDFVTQMASPIERYVYLRSLTYGKKAKRLICQRLNKKLCKPINRLKVEAWVYICAKHIHDFVF